MSPSSSVAERRPHTTHPEDGEAGRSVRLVRASARSVSPPANDNAAAHRRARMLLPLVAAVAALLLLLAALLS